MRKFFWWIRRDTEGRARIEAARRETELIRERLNKEIIEDKTIMESIREKRQTNHLADLFGEAFKGGDD